MVQVMAMAVKKEPRQSSESEKNYQGAKDQQLNQVVQSEVLI